MRISVSPGNDALAVECGTETLGAIVTNQSGGPVYYRSARPVSATQSDGALASGASTTLFGQQWLFVASGTSRADVDVSPIAATTDPLPLSTGQVVAIGHSTISGDGASDTTRDIMTRLAAMLNAKEYNWAKGGACLMWQNDPVRGEYGVLPSFLQSWKRPVRAASTLSAGSSIGATTIAVTPNPSTGSTTGPVFKPGDMIHIGDGTNGEIAVVVSTTSTNINIYNGLTGGDTQSLVRAHNSGDPVYVVPGHYGAGNTLFLFCEAGNLFARYGPGVYANAQRWHQDALRMLLSRMRASEEFNPDHSALVFSGSWGAAVLSPAQSGSTNAQGGRNPTAQNAAVTFHVPDNFPGGAISFNTASIAGNTGGGVWTFTVDGLAAGTMTTVATPTSPVNKDAYFCKRLTNLSAGRHTIVATMTTYEANNYFDGFIIEAIDPPVVMMFRAHRLLSWDAANSTFDHGHIRSTLASAAAVGATSVSVNQTTVSGSRQLTAGSIPKVGEILVVEPTTGDVSPQEIRTVTSVSGSGPYTINFSGGLSRAHASGSAIQLGIKDYDIRNIVNPLVDAMAQEFDGFVLLHDADPYIQKNARWFAPDAAHFNDEGNALVAEKIYRQLANDPHVTPRLISRLSRPVQIPSMRLSFLDGNATAIAWSTMPAALSEFPTTGTSNGNYRRVLDLTRYYEARIGCVQTVLGASNAKLRIQYSIDQGTSWRYLHRVRHPTDPQFTSTNWFESTAATDPMCQIDLVAALPSNGVKYTSFEPIYPEVMQQQYQDTMLRVVGIGGNGVANPALASVWVEFR